MHLRPSSRRGFTVIETFIALAIFSGILVITTMLLKQAVWVWTSGDSREDAMIVLRKARTAVGRDLLRADLDLGEAGELHHDQVQTPSTLGGQDAIWFLSAVGPNEEFVRDEDGFPFWQRNILYYLAKPQGHDALYNIACASGSNPAGDDICPHKMLVRVVIDYPPATTPLPLPPTPPGPGDVPEVLIPDTEIGTYTVAPQGLDTSAIESLPGVEEVRIIATGMLWFKVRPAPGAPTAGLELDMRATAIKEASKTLPVGSVPLLNVPNTSLSIFSLFPNN
jgi:competence protein ComGC